MAKNIEMNWFNGSGYEVLYPFTTIKQVQNLQSTISSINNTISNNYNGLIESINNVETELTNLINSKTMKHQIISRTGGSVQPVTIIFSFLPIIILGMDNTGNRVAGFWFNNKWYTHASGDVMSMYSTITSGTSISWSYETDGINYSRCYFNDDSTYNFIGIA